MSSLGPIYIYSDILERALGRLRGVDYAHGMLGWELSRGFGIFSRRKAGVALIKFPGRDIKLLRSDCMLRTRFQNTRSIRKQGAVTKQSTRLQFQWI